MAMEGETMARVITNSDNNHDDAAASKAGLLAAWEARMELQGESRPPISASSTPP